MEHAGDGHVGAHLRTGDTSQALVGPGLSDPAERSGAARPQGSRPKIPALTAEMLHIFAAGCANQDDVPFEAPERMVGT